MDGWTRHIQLDGCLNLRDIGGYPARDGLRTRPRVVLRSDNLASLSEESRKTLLRYGVHTIIDLRGDWELAKAPSVFADGSGIAYYNIPVFLHDRPAWLPASPYALEDMYCAWLEHCDQQLRLILQTIVERIEGRGGVVAVHCVAGKDRTGLVTALLLSLAGVPPEVIARDYALTMVYMEPVLEDLRRHAAIFAPDPDVARLWVESPPEAMLRTLDYLEEKYGGVEKYLLGTGLSPLHIAKLKSLLVGAESMVS